MIEAAACNIHLRRQAKTLLLFYANRSNSFRPSLKFIERETGIPENKVSSVRKILDEHGLVAYRNYPGFIFIAWGNIRAYALLQKPLRIPRDKTKYTFYPAVLVKEKCKEKEVKIGKVWMTEREYYDMVEAVREVEFPSMPKGEFHKTGVYTSLFSDKSNLVPSEGDDLQFPIIVTTELPF